MTSLKYIRHNLWFLFAQEWQVPKKCKLLPSLTPALVKPWSYGMRRYKTEPIPVCRRETNNS